MKSLWDWHSHAKCFFHFFSFSFFLFSQEGLWLISFFLLPLSETRLSQWGFIIILFWQSSCARLMTAVKTIMVRMVIIFFISFFFWCEFLLKSTKSFQLQNYGCWPPFRSFFRRITGFFSTNCLFLGIFFSSETPFIPSKPPSITTVFSLLSLLSWGCFSCLEVILLFCIRKLSASKTQKIRSNSLEIS